MSRPERSGGRVTSTEKKNDRPRRPVSDEGGDRLQAGHRGAGGAASVVLRREADCAKAREPERPNEVRSHRERAKRRKPEGLGSQRAAPVCRRPGAPPNGGRAERPRVFAVAEPAATPEDRQSERSEVCRDRATEKYKMPEGRAGRRAAVVRPGPEAGREPLRGGRARMPSGRRGGAERSAARPRRTIATAREGRGERRGRRCTKPVGSDAAARPRRLQRRTLTSQIFETSTQNQSGRMITKHAAGK